MEFRKIGFVVIFLLFISGDFVWDVVLIYRVFDEEGKVTCVTSEGETVKSKNIVFLGYYQKVC